MILDYGLELSLLCRRIHFTCCSPHSQGELSPHCFRLRHMRCRHFAGNLVAATRYRTNHWTALLSLGQVRLCSSYTRLQVYQSCLLGQKRGEQENSVLTQIANPCVQQRGEEENETRRSPTWMELQAAVALAGRTVQRASGESDPTESFIHVRCDMRPCAVHLPCSFLSLVFAQTIPSDGGIERASKLQHANLAKSDLLRWQYRRIGRSLTIPPSRTSIRELVVGSARCR